MTPTPIKMADGKTRTGLLLGQGDLDATLLEVDDESHAGAVNLFGF